VKVEGSRVLVTGGASGLGEAIVRMFGAGGATVTISDLPNSAGRALADELGESVAFRSTDVTDEGQVTAAVDFAVRHGEGLDVCVNCAGINPGGRLLGPDGVPRSLDRFRSAIEVNLIGLVDVIRRSVAAMTANEPNEDGERGLIVNLASIAAFEGQAGQSAYTASKAGVGALTLQLARELAPVGIRVLAIAPGMMDTPMFEGIGEAERQALTDLHIFPRRLGRAAELAGLVRCLVETPMMNGAVIRIDAGARLR